MASIRSLLLAPSLASLLLTTGCAQPVYADRIAVPVTAPSAGGQPQIAIAVAPAKVRAPYDVQVIREGGETAPTYAHRDRFYVAGNAGERYIIRITNPTANRIEAVVSVDGLDVVDGEAGDLRKRGYVVPPYGETRIEGFRTSHEDVATFRFSSVKDSYAGKKGVARNVGVIAVALFEEERVVEQQQIIITDSPNYRQPYDFEDDVDEGGDYYGPSANRGGGRSAKDKSVASADRPAKTAAPRSESKKMAPSEDSAPTTASRPAPAPPQGGTGGAPSRRFDGDFGGESVELRRPVQKERPGLGTEFGEQRYSAASFTKFVRAAGRPIAIAELRYNDTAGLMALGIPVAPMPDEGEIMTRETADPFPGDSRFATPPR